MVVTPRTEGSVRTVRNLVLESPGENTLRIQGNPDVYNWESVGLNSDCIFVKVNLELFN